MNLLDESMTDKTKTVIEYSSGSTVISMSLMARIFHGTDDTHAFLSNKTSKTKLKLMQFFGLDLFVINPFRLACKHFTYNLGLLIVFRTLFGGPSQPEPLDKRGGIFKANEQARNDPATVNPNQYENKAVSEYLYL